MVLPYLGLFVYLIVRGKGMTERAAKERAANREAMEEYIRTTAGGGGGPASEIAMAKSLLDSGSITQEDFEALKRKSLG